MSLVETSSIIARVLVRLNVLHSMLAIRGPVGSSVFRYRQWEYLSHHGFWVSDHLGLDSWLREVPKAPWGNCCKGTGVGHISWEMMAGR
jgi:hypothetical protein